VLNPGKGLNNALSDNLIDDREASDLENIQFVESGAPAKAYGFTQAGNTLSNNPRGLGFYNDAAAGNRDLLTVDGTALKYLNGSTWTTISGASFDSSAQINMTQAGGSMYVWDGVNGGAKLATGRTLSRPGTLPKGKFSIYYNGFHVCAGVATQENRLYISASTDTAAFTRKSTDSTLNNTTEVPGATDFTTTTTAAFVDINKNDGDKITALAKFQDALIIFKERAIFQLTFDSTGTPVVAAVSKGYGCVSHRSVDNIDNDVFFLTRNGVYVLGNEPNYFNTIRTNELTARVHPTIETINPTNFTLATALFNKYVYYLGIPSGGVSANNVTLAYDRRFQAWSKLTHIAPEAMTLYVDSSNNESVYFTSSTSAKVYVMSSNYSADGSAISAQWTSKAYDLGDFSTYKRWIDVTILFRQLVGNVDITVYTDNGTIAKSVTVNSSSTGGIGSYQFGGGDFGGTLSSNSATVLTNNIPYRIKLSAKSRTIKVKISNSRSNETFVVLGLEFTHREYSHFVFPSAYRIS
jgi:hypothetical protein